MSKSSATHHYGEKYHIIRDILRIYGDRNPLVGLQVAMAKSRTYPIERELESYWQTGGGRRKAVTSGLHRARPRRSAANA